MKFGEDKCAYVLIISRKRKSGNGPIEINGLKVRELKDEEEYKYLGQDESVGYSGPLNKERVVKEYKKRVRKIWYQPYTVTTKSRPTTPWLFQSLHQRSAEAKVEPFDSASIDLVFLNEFFYLVKEYKKRVRKIWYRPYTVTTKSRPTTPWPFQSLHQRSAF